MDAPVADKTVEFEGWRFDPRSAVLLHRDVKGIWDPVPVGARARDILAVLLERPGDLVSKDELIGAAWPNVAVEPNNLTVQIATLRRVLDEQRAGESCIQTVPGRGYRFVLAVSSSLNDVHPSQAEAPGMAPVDQPDPPLTPGSGLRRWFATGSSAVLLMAAVLIPLGFAGGWRLMSDRNAALTTLPVAYSPQDRRLSVIVLPFENGSDDPSQDNLAVSFTRDLTSQVAQDSAIPVVPAATAAAFRGKTPDLHAIRREYNVHFAIEGSIRRAHGRLIVAVNTFDTSDDRSVRSDRFDLPDTSQSWDYLLRGIADGYVMAGMGAEFARAKLEHPNNLDKRDLMFASFALSLLGESKNNYVTKMALVDRALALDPDYVWALHRSARLAADNALGGFSTDPKADLALALTRVDRALQLAPNDFEALKHKSHILRVQGDLDGATAVIKRLLELNPVSGFRYFDLGLIRLMQGHPEEMLTDMQTARRLASRDDPSDVQAMDAWLAMALFANGRFEEAIPQARLAMGELPNDTGQVGEVPWLALIAAEYLGGNEAVARTQLQRFLSTTRMNNNLDAVQRRPTLAATPRLQEALRGAGMPER